MKRKAHSGYIAYGITILVLLGYILFPGIYLTVSESLFGAFYTYHASERPVPEESGDLRTIARPPQTPYDTLLVLGEARAGRYVYSKNGRPVGYVGNRQGRVKSIILFSSSLSDEIFSVNGHTVKGRGTGSGSFSLITPIDDTITPGSVITHQGTGKAVSRVVTIAVSPETNTQEVRGLIAINPLQTSALYLPEDGGERILLR